MTLELLLPHIHLADGNHLLNDQTSPSVVPDDKSLRSSTSPRFVSAPKYLRRRLSFENTSSQELARVRRRLRIDADLSTSSLNLISASS